MLGSWLKTNRLIRMSMLGPWLGVRLFARIAGGAQVNWLASVENPMKRNPLHDLKL